MIKAAIGNTRTSEFVMAEGEFNLGKYVELLKIENNGEVKS